MARIFNAATSLRPPGFANSGAGTRWYVNSAGIHTSVAGTAERIEYTLAGALLGLLNEPGDTNYCAQSRNFFDSAWFKNTGTALSTVSETGVDGAATATRDLASQYSTVAKTDETGAPASVGHTIFVKSRTGAAQSWAFWDGSVNNFVTVGTTWGRVGYGPTAHLILDFYPGAAAGGDILLDCAMSAAGYTLNGVWYPGSFILTTGPNIGVRAADAYTFLLAAGATALTFTFDDGSKQTISGLTGGTTYQIPILNRPWILYIDDNTAAGGAVYASSIALGGVLAQTSAALLLGTSAATLAASGAVAVAGRAVAGSQIPLAAAAALAGAPSLKVAVSAALAEIAGLSGAAKTTVATALTLGAVAAQASGSKLTAASALTLAEIAGLTETGAITAAQGAALSMALAAAASSGGTAYISAMALAATAATAAAGRGALVGAASLQSAPAITGAAQLAATGSAALTQAQGAMAASSAILVSAAALIEAVGAQASTGGAQAYSAAVSLAAQALAQASGSCSVAASAPLPARLGLSGAAAGLYAGALALLQAEDQGAQGQAVAVAAAALSEALGTGAGTGGPQGYAASVALAAAALQAATATSGQAALASLAASAGTLASGSLTANAALALAETAGATAAAAITVAAGTTFQASTRVLATGGVIVTGTLSLPVDPAFASRAAAVSGPSLAFTARLDQAAASTISGAAAAQFAAQAALIAALQIGDPYAGAPQLKGIRTVTLTLQGRRVGTRTLAGTMRLTLMPQAPTRH